MKITKLSDVPDLDDDRTRRQFNIKVNANFYGAVFDWQLFYLAAVEPTLRDSDFHIYIKALRNSRACILCWHTKPVFHVIGIATTDVQLIEYLRKMMSERLAHKYGNKTVAQMRENTSK